jgi:hypothetical protein
MRRNICARRPPAEKSLRAKLQPSGISTKITLQPIVEILGRSPCSSEDVNNSYGPPPRAAKASTKTVESRWLIRQNGNVSFVDRLRRRRRLAE